MGIRSAFADSIDALKRNPVLFVAAVVVSLINAAALGVQSFASAESAAILSSGISFLVQLIALFFVGGAYAMARDGLDGTTTLRTLVAGGKEYYASLLGATLLLVLVSIVSVVAVAIVGVVVVLSAGLSLVGGDPTGFALLLSAIYLLGLLPIFFLQFYGPAVVVSGADAFESVRQSFGVVRRNLLRTLGFDVVVAAAMVVGASPTIALYASRYEEMVASPETFSLLAGLDGSTVAAFLVATLVLGTLTGAFFWTYQVAFYEELVAGTDGDDGSGSDEPAVDSQPEI